MKNLSMKDTKLIIVVGAGGVGKTTMAGLLALKEAKNKNVLVITVDPAKRLLDALGIKSKAKSPIPVMLPKNYGGHLFAFMPDLKKEWHDFLMTAISDSSIRHDISKNPFFLYMLEGLPGAFEIICSHVMFRLKNSGEYDVIVLDTPPSAQSLNFFIMPERISKVLEEDVFKILVSKKITLARKLFKKIAFFSSGLLEKTIERIMGNHFFSELIDFALSLDCLYEPLYLRTKAMTDMIFSKKTEFVLVTRPTFSSYNDAISLKNNLYEKNIHLNRLIINMICPQISKDVVEYFDSKSLINDNEYKELKKYIDFISEKIAHEQKVIVDLKKNFKDIPIYEMEKKSGDIWSLFDESIGY